MPSWVSMVACWGKVKMYMSFRSLGTVVGAQVVANILVVNPCGASVNGELKDGLELVLLLDDAIYLLPEIDYGVECGQKILLMRVILVVTSWLRFATDCNDSAMVMVSAELLYLSYKDLSCKIF